MPEDEELVSPNPGEADGQEVPAGQGKLNVRNKISRVNGLLVFVVVNRAGVPDRYAVGECPRVNEWGQRWSRGSTQRVSVTNMTWFRMRPGWVGNKPPFQLGQPQGSAERAIRVRAEEATP